MANVNKVILIGRLTRDPELRFTASGTAVCDLGLAINRVTGGADGSGERREETTFVDVTVWARQAEACAQYLKKGREAYVEGRLQLDQWQDDAGNNRRKLKVVAERVQFLGGPRNDGQPQPSGSAGVPSDF